MRLLYALPLAIVVALLVAGGSYAHDAYIYGTPSGDVIEGHAHYDAIWGYQGADELYGWDDQDFLQGGEDDDTLFGGQGADIIVGGGGTDVLFGGKGNDYITDKQAEPGITQTIKCGDGDDWFAVPVHWESGVQYNAYACEHRDVIIPDPPPRKL